MKKCKKCAMEIEEVAKICPHCRSAQKMAMWKKVLIGFACFIILVAIISNKDDSTKTSTSVSTSKHTEVPKPSEAPKPNIPAEYKSALYKAESYANTMHMSKKGVYSQLVSEYGEKFSAAAAQYAIDNIQADWNANALAKAKSYQDTMHMSPDSIRDQLTSEHGEKFTKEESNYAIQHLNE